MPRALSVIKWKYTFKYRCSLRGRRCAIDILLYLACHERLKSVSKMQKPGGADCPSLPSFVPSPFPTVESVSETWCCQLEAVSTSLHVNQSEINMLTSSSADLFANRGVKAFCHYAALVPRFSSGSCLPGVLPFMSRPFSVRGHFLKMCKCCE